MDQEPIVSGEAYARAKREAFEAHSREMLQLLVDRWQKNARCICDVTLIGSTTLEERDKETICPH